MHNVFASDIINNVCTADLGEAIVIFMILIFIFLIAISLQNKGFKKTTLKQSENITQLKFNKMLSNFEDGELLYKYACEYIIKKSTYEPDKLIRTIVHHLRSNSKNLPAEISDYYNRYEVKSSELYFIADENKLSEMISLYQSSYQYAKYKLKI